ncbi:hypothetical protein JAAARDRAFT_174906 [Jaapia argillacea MUCL 33604]|uniref:BTB domain-containing protein n=1 Tax=Jaapia argillacea MUCL 33604 TaxID=933084 RepID=A0A067Q7R4_9AGAM|nr:hypothetical protein JAAARDRAFT_174906 [Jaapia argillacea MUCL 33604]
MSSSGADGQPALKRTRVNEPNQNDTVPLRHSDVWFDDGNLMVIAESTVFKVFKGQLAKASPIFHDMFGLSSSGVDLLDGCPVVHLSDSVEDVAVMLRAVHQWQNYRYQDLQSFTTVRAFLRMGKKYSIDFLWEDGLRRLQSDFPPTLQCYEGAISDWITIEHQPGITYDVISLCGEIGVLSCLPFALYVCASENNFQNSIVAGWVRDDNSVAKLTPEDQVRCFRGRERLLAFQAEESFGWLHPQDYGGNGSVTCPSGANLCRVAKLELFARMTSPPFTLRALDAWDETWEHEICAGCIEVGKQEFEDNRKTAWDRLPSFFDLPPWSELKSGDSF